MSEIFNQTIAGNYHSSYFLVSQEDDVIQSNLKFDEFFNPCSEVDLSSGTVQAALSTLKDSAAGHDGLPAKFLRELASVIAVSFSIIFGQSHFSQTVPDMWRNAVVIPKGDHKDPNNYRPISLTCIPCKIMETLITATIMSHMESNQYLSDSQYSFRKGRSTTSLLLKSINGHITCLDNECDVDVIYLDFAKAFDSVDHALLPQKLSWYNLQPNVICCISNFLSE